MRAIVCGAGIAGLATAYFLARKGWDVTVLERAAHLRTGGYGVDFFASGYDAAEAGGLLPALQARHLSLAGVVYVNQHDQVRSRIEYRQLAASLKGRLLSLLRGDLEQILHDALPDTVELRFGTSIEQVHGVEGAADLTLTDGTPVTADLLVGADGVHSHVRELVFGPEARFLRYLGYQTAAYLLNDTALAQASHGWCRLLSVPKRQVAFYPLGGDRLAALFAHSAASPSRPADPAAELHRVYGDLGWYLPSMLAAAERADDIYYDVVAQIEMPRWCSGRAVLVGDAGYAVSLLAGQGASLAIGGAYLLAEAVAEGNIEAGLERFEAALAPEVRKLQAAGRRVADWFVPPTAFHNWARDAVLNVVRVPGLAGLLGRFLAPSLKSVVRPAS